MNPEMEKLKENHNDHLLEIQFIGLDIFADTDEELKTLGMTDADVAKFREWQLDKVNAKKVRNE